MENEEVNGRGYGLLEMMTDLRKGILVSFHVVRLSIDIVETFNVPM
jgi:hypothetical protein